jgi:hypothetical protein
MMAAAGIDAAGPSGMIRAQGLAVLFARVLGTFVRDEDPGLARTMAALDRRLRRGERTVRNVEQAGSVLYRFATDAPGFLRSVLRGRDKTQTGPEAKPDPQPTAL